MGPTAGPCRPATGAPANGSAAVWNGIVAGRPPRVLPGLLLRLLLGALLAALPAGCGDLQRRDTVGTTPRFSAPLADGDYLYCISNVGHTLLAYDLAQRQVVPGSARYLDLDPVGPWFAGAAGYYLSRVDSSGAGANALIRFDPRSGAEQARLKFPPNSNPNSLLLLPPPHAGLAWVALRGSTFDNFATDGLSVVDVATLRDTAFCDLNADTATCPRLVPDTGSALASPLGFLWDAACPANGGAGCAYAVVNNFDGGGVRDGRLLVLAPDPTTGVPTLLDSVPLGRNPLQDVVLDATGLLWVVNNGGYVHFDASGQAGTLQALDTQAFASGAPGDGTVATLPLIDPVTPEADCAATPQPRPDPGCDPTGIYSLDGLAAWVTTYPDDVLRTVNLAARTLAPLDASLPRVTGPFFPVTGDPLSAGGPALFAALGGLGQARLGELSAAGTALLRDQSLLAGAAPLSCAAHSLP